MPGTAGSKYGIIDDEIPLKMDFTVRKNSNDTNSTRSVLKNVRPILRALKSKASDQKSH